MLMDVTTTRILLANLAASFLLLQAFLIMAVMTVVMFMLWRGLHAAEPEARRLVGQLADYMRQAESITYDTAQSVVRPQIGIASTWVGLKVGVRALVARGPGAAGEPPKLPL